MPRSSAPEVYFIIVNMLKYFALKCIFASVQYVIKILASNAVAGESTSYNIHIFYKKPSSRPSTKSFLIFGHIYFQKFLKCFLI